MLLNRSSGHHLKAPTFTFRSISAASTTTTSSNTNLSNINTKNQLLKSYKITPPIKPWPQKLSPKRLVSILTSQQNLDLALQIFDFAGKYHPNFDHTYDTYQIIIHRLCRARAFEAVETLLVDLRKSNIICGENLFIVVIRNYGIASKPKMALKMFLRIKKEFLVKASVRSFNTLLNALIQNKEFDLVYVLFKNCRKKFDIVPNVFTCNLLIKALCKKGDVEGAIRILDEIPGMGMVPNVVSYTTVLGGYVARGDMAGSKRVFDEIIDRGWLPDATTYTILMDGFVRY
ncbi:hypothetical protein Leryth_013140 [Lithospermum erythrorhizon]|nr:hypothetical protein Leryth_013140 [Lithospermum erythrorhizon]